MTMDYTYIEQLLEKYFNCETSQAEERILGAFFAQESVPVHLLSYRQLFTEPERSRQEETLGSAFDQRILDIISAGESRKPVRVKASMVTMQHRLRPLYKAAACVAVVLALGQAAQMPYREGGDSQQNVASVVRKPDVMPSANTVAKSDSVASAAKVVEKTLAN